MRMTREFYLFVAMIVSIITLPLVVILWLPTLGNSIEPWHQLRRKITGTWYSF